MNISVESYAGKKLCVAVSGGRDSMCLLHYLINCAAEHKISLSALNCDHGIRGEESERDSAFVKAYCAANGVKLHFFKWTGEPFSDESSARLWRLSCYKKVISSGEADLVATAHHSNDNAETVLFNLARGTSLYGLTGITDNPTLGLVRPLIGCSRAEIDAYIAENNIEYVTDSTNLSDSYTRNKIRHSLIPVLEEAVPGAVKNIYRFSRLAAEDEEYFAGKVTELISHIYGGYLIKPCPEKVIFRRACQTVIGTYFKKKDYTSAHFERLFSLQQAQNNKKFSFLGITAVRQKEGLALVLDEIVNPSADGMPFYENLKNGDMRSFAEHLALADRAECLQVALSSFDVNTLNRIKVLRFDLDKIPRSAIIRFKRTGDKFNKFGGGTKSLGDYLTDKKVPQSVRASLPLVCDGANVLVIGGVEISESVKVEDSTQNIGVFICLDPFKN